MAGWHHWLDGRESQWTPGVGDGQGGLACCDSWGRKESDTTERLIWSDLIIQTSVLTWGSRNELWGWHWKLLNSSWGDNGKVPEKVESKVESGVPWRSLKPFQGSYKVQTIFLIILRYYLPFLCVQWSLPRAYWMCALTIQRVQSSYETVTSCLPSTQRCTNI